MTRIDTAFKMGCMTAVGYGVGTALKVNPKAMALTWLCGEVALKVFAKVKDLPLPTVLAAGFVSLQLSTKQLIEDTVRSHSLTMGAFVISSILMDKVPALFNKLWQTARNAYENEDFYAMEERVQIREENDRPYLEETEETSDEETDDYPQATVRPYDRQATNRYGFT